MDHQMYMSYMFVICLIIITKQVVMFSSNTCPPPSLSTLVAEKECNDSSEYHCLYNRRSKLYETYCFNVRTFLAGSFVLYEEGVNLRSCSAGRYQPDVYFSNQSNSKCVYSKTRCSEEGQVVHDSSFTEKDATCRCDYSKSFDFVVKPKNRCFCIPTEEDCSCYKRQCPENMSLSPDYLCLENFGLISCPVIKHKRDEPTYGKINVKTDTGSIYSTTTYKSEFHMSHICGVVTGMVMLLIITYVIGFVLLLMIKNKNKEDTSSGEMPTPSKILAAEIISDASNKHDVADASSAQDVAFLTRNGFQKSKDVLEMNRLIVIKGRYGTGKSFMANQIALKFSDYTKTVICRKDIFKYGGLEQEALKRVIIFDEVCDIYEDVEERSKIIQIIQSFFNQSSYLIVITVGEFSNAFLESLRKMSFVGEDNLIDLDIEYALSKEEKLFMLNHYMKELKSRLGSESHLNAVLLSENVKEEIISTDTYYGFPLLCKTFCDNLDNIQLGAKYFRQPPKMLIDEILRIRVAAANGDKSSRVQHLILIYILISKDCCININDIDCSLIKEITRDIFGIGDLANDFTQYLNMKDIPLQRFLQYMGDGKYKMHQAVYQAVMLLTSKHEFKSVLKKCKLEHILDLYRMPNYEPVLNEVYLPCKMEAAKTFCEIVSKRMANASLLDDTSAHMVCQFIIRNKNDNLSQDYLTCLKDNISNFISAKHVHLLLVIFAELVLDPTCGMLSEMVLGNTMSNIKDIYWFEAWAVLACNKYGKCDLIFDLMKTAVFSDTTFPEKILGIVVDEYDNNMLTYCTLWWTTESDHPFVRTVSNVFSQPQRNPEVKNVFSRTKEGLSPLVFASYFGRHQCLQMFLLMQAQKAEKKILRKAALYKLKNEIDELIEVAKKGEKKIIFDKIKYNTEICPKVELCTEADFEKTLTVLERLKVKLARDYRDSAE